MCGLERTGISASGRAQGNTRRDGAPMLGQALCWSWDPRGASLGPNSRSSGRGGGGSSHHMQGQRQGGTGTERPGSSQWSAGLEQGATGAKMVREKATQVPAPDLEDPSLEDRLHLGDLGECLQGKDITRLGWLRVGI